MTYFVEHVNTAIDAVVRIGEASSIAEAIDLAQRTIDEFLEGRQQHTTCADALYSAYAASGLIPCIFCDDEETMNVRTFDHLQYASVKCVRLYSKFGRDISDRGLSWSIDGR